VQHPARMPFAVPDDLEVDAARVEAVRKQLQAGGVEHCYAAFVDVHGIPKSKAAPIACFAKMCRGGELYTVGANEGLGLAGPHEDECATVPDLDSLIVFPWDGTQAFFAADLWYRGAPYANDPRGFLRRTAERARAMGYAPMLGIEPELYVLRRGAGGALEPITTSRFRGPNACYDLNLTTESMDFLDPMRKHLESLGWGLYSFDQECGRGQYEFDFGYTDAVTMADRFVFFRLMAKKVAQSIGAVASFMPKPFADDFRSGAHFNLSLAHVEGGGNAFADPPGALARKYGVDFSDTALHFTAGMLRHAGAITALCCPTYNSFQGLVARGELREFSWAPVLALWGRNNRSAMLRLPGNRKCVENRAVDMATNPYLSAALCFAAGLEGVEQKLDPGAGAEDDLYKRTRRELVSLGIGTLPPTLLHAVEAFEADPLVERVFGAEFRDLYATLRRREWEEVFYHVSDWQRARDLDFV
jgi:glutamine synthetase